MRYSTNVDELRDLNTKVSRKLSNTIDKYPSYAIGRDILDGKMPTLRTRALLTVKNHLKKRSKYYLIGVNILELVIVIATFVVSIIALSS